MLKVRLGQEARTLGNAQAVGVDIGFTNLRVGTVDASGRVGRHVSVPTDSAGGADAVLRQVVDAVAEVSDDVVGVGVGVAGQCDIEHGVVKCGPNLFWEEEPLQKRLEDALGLPVVLRNDVIMATVGEWRHGAGRGARDMLCLMVGTGIGGGAIVDGRLLQGAHGCGGHFGHLSVQEDGALCGCGRKGCVEAYASGCGLARRAQASPELSGSEMLEIVDGDTERITGRDVAMAAMHEDALAVRLRDEAAAALGSALASLINCFNPEKVVLGGTVLMGMPALFDMATQEALRTILPSHWEGLAIVPSELGSMAGVIGAGSWVLRPL